MKVKVNYYAFNTAEIEVDELNQVLSSQIPGDICAVDDENGELIYGV